MIVQTTRIGRDGGVQYLARHLLDKTEENERIEVLAGDRSALDDAQALAQVKGCRYSVRHLSISPEKEMSPAALSAFVRMVDAEFGFGADRPRLVVRHVKEGRSHFHVAIAEVDPVSLRVLDCRQDFSRLEDLARRYEADHGEHVQPTRAERRAAKVEGFSDIARKRAERTSPGFERSRLKVAFVTGPDAFFGELKTQGLRIIAGEKGPILVTSDGVFVASASRAAGIRKNEFLKFMETIHDDKLIGTQPGRPGHASDGRTQHSEAPAAPVVAQGGRGRPGPGRATDGIASALTRHAAAAGIRAEVRRRQDRSPLPAIAGRRREDVMLARLNRELDELLRRARELASWVVSIFEPPVDRLTREIEATRKRKSSPLPAVAAEAPPPSYVYGRRMTP